MRITLHGDDIIKAVQNDLVSFIYSETAQQSVNSLRQSRECKLGAGRAISRLEGPHFRRLVDTTLSLVSCGGIGSLHN